MRRDQGKRDQGLRASRSRYGWITEGLDTRDLKEDKALLEELCGVACLHEHD